MHSLLAVPPYFPPPGRYWCWVHWSFQATTFDFLGCKEALVRAWDSSQNGQPAYITWNVMGMMNNCYYRVKIHRQVDDQVRHQGGT
jgi:nitrate reductase (NAD(P)H)